MGSNKETLCWRCKRPGTRTCSWDDSKGTVPVEGWTAIPEPYRCGGTTYLVIDCPMFEPEENYRKRSMRGLAEEKEKTTQEPREKRKQIERLFGYGRSNKEIAEKFNLSVRTIEGYKTRWRKGKKK